MNAVMTKDLPRTVVISAAIPETRFAGSLLLYRLLHGFPRDRLVAIGPSPHPGSLLLDCQYYQLKAAPSSRLNITRLAKCKRSLEAFGVLGQLPLKTVDKMLNGFRPEVVVSVMERLDYSDAAFRFCQERSLPLVLIIHDLIDQFEQVYPWAKAAQSRRYGSIYRAAAARLCVSPGLRDRFELRYGVSGDVLYPSRSDNLVARAFGDCATLKNPGELTIGYAGGMAYGYGEKIREIMPLLAASGVRLRIYSRDALTKAIAGTEHAGSWTPDEAWNRVKAECDVVLLPYSSSAEHRDLYETHFPSKLTEYLALGMPVLICGPAYAAGVAWGLRHPKSALTIAGPAREELVEACRRLVASPELRLQLARGASEAGKAEFDPREIRDQFLETLVTARHGHD